jgi:hypothetical protein
VLLFDSMVGLEEVVGRGVPAGGKFQEDLRRRAGSREIDLMDEQSIRLLEAAAAIR